MNKIVPDPPCLTPDRAIFERALSHYLQPDSLPSFTAHHDLSFEDALARSATCCAAPPPPQPAPRKRCLAMSATWRAPPNT